MHRHRWDLSNGFPVDDMRTKNMSVKDEIPGSRLQTLVQPITV